MERLHPKSSIGKTGTRWEYNTVMFTMTVELAAGQ
jgi:hypothetical protein